MEGQRGCYFLGCRGGRLLETEFVGLVPLLGCNSARDQHRVDERAGGVWVDLERYCTDEGSAPPLDREGFLSTRWGLSGNGQLPPGLFSVADACAGSTVVLGEAGAGKSHVLHAAFQGLLAGGSSSVPVAAHACVDLGGISSYEQLKRKARPVLGLTPPPATDSAPPVGTEQL